MKVRVIFSQEDSDLEDPRWYVAQSYKPPYYPRIGITRNGKTSHIYAHRLVLHRKLGRELAAGEIADHINGDVLDCRRDNLRAVSHTGSVQNRKSKHGRFRGTTFNKKAGKWQSYVKVNRKNIHLGVFTSRIEAAKAAAEARKNFGFLSGNGA